MDTTRIGHQGRVLTLTAACLALFVIFLDNTIVNVALPSIQRDLSATPDALESVVSAYVVAFAGLVLLGGTLGDRFGRRRLFIARLLLFAAASAAGPWHPPPRCCPPRTPGRASARRCSRRCRCRC